MDHPPRRNSSVPASGETRACAEHEIQTGCSGRRRRTGQTDYRLCSERSSSACRLPSCRADSGLMLASLAPVLPGPAPAAYVQNPQAVGGSLGLSALVSVLPLAVVLVLLGALRVRAHWAALAGLATALLVAVLGFGMPVGISISAALHGAFYGLFPILWIVVNALWVFNMTVASGHFDVLTRSL